MDDENKLCPLCSAVLEKKSKGNNEVVWLQCPTLFAWSTTYKQIVISHYTFEKSYGGIEHIYIPPFCINTYYQSNESRILKLVQTNITDRVSITDIVNNTIYINEWQLVSKTSLIKSEPTDKMLKRINLLLTFL